jgi:hypothetical protein
MKPCTTCVTSFACFFLRLVDVAFIGYLAPANISTPLIDQDPSCCSRNSYRNQLQSGCLMAPLSVCPHSPHYGTCLLVTKASSFSPIGSQDVPVARASLPMLFVSKLLYHHDVCARVSVTVPSSRPCEGPRSRFHGRDTVRGHGNISRHRATWQE